ncbi:MAG: hypothetical protein K2N34_07405 [Lachnospiraceae bacterium]|nr:hypothetical protein [Lachnospiraceae bacterium]
MPMKINGRYSQYQTDYAERLKAEQEKAWETEKGQNDEKASGKMPVSHDEYISSEKSGAKPSGLYRLGQDEDGRKKVFFDDPKKSDNADGNEQPKVKSDNPEKPAEKCTGSTDKVDREIKKLKEKKRQLEQQITSAFGDEKKVKKLEKKLAQVESELSQKDNDTYRRQHATFSE